MNKTRLLFVVDDLSITNGANCQLIQLAQNLSGMQFEIHIATFCDARCLGDFPVPDTQLYCLNPKITEFNKIIELRQLIQAISPDIIHAWGYGTHLAVAFSQSRINTVKLIYSYFCVPPRRLMVRRWLDEFVSRAPAIVAASHQNITKSLNADGFDHPIHIVPNAFVDSVSNRAESRQKLIELTGIADDRVFLAGTVGPMEPRFRIKDLIWATDIMFCVRDDVHLLIFGSGSGKGALEHFLSNTESTSNVHILDSRKISVHDLAGLDAYWNAQLVEANPAIMLTAMSQGVPAVSVADRATADAILPMRSGLGTNFGARDEFARWTKFLIEQLSHGKQLAAQGREHVKKNFPVRQMVDGYLNLYESTR